MQGLVRDLRFGARMLRKNAGFAVLAILTLALGIGANSALFAVTSALLLRPFPYRHPQQLVSVEEKEQGQDTPASLLRYELLRDHSRTLDSVAVWANDTFNLTGHGQPLQVPVARVSPNFFSLLGVRPELGRTFSVEEGRPEGKFVVMLSNAFWHSRFGGDPNIVGQTITLDDTPHTVIGVLPAGVQFPFVGPADIWSPRYFELTLMPMQRLRLGVGYLAMLGRLRPRTTLAQAQAELSVLDREYHQQNPTAPDARASVTMTAEPLRDLVVAGVRGKVLLLSAAVALVLLIACANVASLLLARSLARSREIAVRAALGASRVVLVRQLLTESMMLASAGGALGIGLSWLALRAFLTWGTGQFPREIPITVDWGVLLFTLVVSLLTGVLFGSFPALQLSRAEPAAGLREEGRGASAGRSHLRMNGMLVAGQIALSLLLLIGAGLLLRSFERLLQVDPGFEARNLLTMNVSLPTVKYAKPEQQIAFFDEALRRISALPGVRVAAISAALPLSFERITPVLPEGQPNLPLAQRPFLDIEAVSPQWFAAMRVPLLTGRVFTAADNRQAPKVLIVNQTFARRFWPGQNPVGKHVIVGRWTEAAEVVGVTADVKNRGLARNTLAQVYIPFPQLPWSDMNLLVRTALPPLSMAAAVRGQISALDPDQPVTGIRSAQQLVDSSLAQPRFTMLLLGVFAAAALALAVIGIYGMLAYSVAQRRHELGIRVALGAERAHILRLVVGEGITLAIAGIAIGLAAAWFLTRLMSSLLYQVRARDLFTFALAPVVFLAIAVLASYLPARRATRADPMEALRGN